MKYGVLGTGDVAHTIGDKLIELAIRSCSVHARQTIHKRVCCPPILGYAVEGKAARSIEKSLRKLLTEYIDLLLLCAQVASKVIDIPNFHILLILLPVKPIRKQ